MAITAAMVKELREATGVGMLDCKNALAETDGNMEAAIELLREKGLAASQKKAGRIAAEGAVGVLVSEDKKTGVVVEVNSETDFVSKNPVFQEYVAQVSEHTISTDSSNIEEMLAENWKFDTTLTVAEALSQKISVIGENLQIRRFEKFEAATNGKVVSYVHGTGRIGVLVELACANDSDELDELGKNLAMQIAALNPKFIKTDDVPQEYIEHEKDILAKQAKEDPKNANKPDNIIEKMIEGRLAKELKEFCLIEQAYVKDGEMTVKQYIASVAKTVGAPIELVRFVRFETGEGIEKKEENFADEVAKAMR